MSISASKTNLENDIFSAYKKKMEAGGSSEGSTGDIIIDLSNDIAIAINKYYITAQVTTKVTVEKGQPDALGGMSDKIGEGDGFGAIVSKEKIGRTDVDDDDDEGKILSYIGGGLFQTQFEEAGLIELTHSDVEMEED